MELLQVFRLQVLIRLRLGQLIVQPLDRAFFVLDGKGHLDVFELHNGTLLVVFVDLVGKEIHIVALHEMLVEATIKFSSIHGDRNTMHEMPCDHAVIK